MSSWTQNKRQEERGSNEGIEMYNIGTMKSGTDRSLEDSISGYTPVMVDRRGNRRFHGAFTGGFSAGHFNTVGSVQGYKPKYDTWTSSRNNRNQQSIQQTPMDFMDDEDMATNTNLLTTSQHFNSLNNESMNQFNQNKSNINKHFGNTMINYLSIDNNTMCNHSKGIQLLKKCGWRTGKNIGDKSNITRLKLLLKRQDQLLLNNNNINNSNILFGNHIFNTTETNNENKNTNDKLVSMYRPKMKTDMHGVGYGIHTENINENITTTTQSGHKRFNSSISNTQPLHKKRKLLPTVSSVRHGLSALEEVEIGDDVYGDHIEYDTFITHSDNEEVIVMTDNKLQRKHFKHKHKKVKPTNKIKSRNGTLPINGFVVATMPDNNQYMLKQQMSSNDYNKYMSDGYKHFKTNKMEINKQFIDKLSHLDLTVGSFLCRNIRTKTGRSKVLGGENEIPDIIPDAQQKGKSNYKKESEKKLCEPLSKKFTSQEMMTGDEYSFGLRAGLTLSEHIPADNKQKKKANDILNDIRKIYGNESAEKLLRFDVFIADKIGIESPISETENSLIFNDGFKTQFQLNMEKYEFEQEWDKLKEYGQFLYCDKKRLYKKQIKESEQDKIYNKIKYAKQPINAQQAATHNLYGDRTRIVEMWIPNRLLCKRCNIRDPYEGMYNQQKNKRGNQKNGQLFGGNLLNRKQNNNNNKIQDVIESRGEQVAAILEENESDFQPPVLQLKQWKTWNSYLNEMTSGNKGMIVKEDPEMKSFIDSILNDDVSDNENKKDEIENIKQQQEDMSLFKSIFDNDNDSESSFDDDDEELEQDDNVKIGVEMDEISNNKIFEYKDEIKVIPKQQMMEYTLNEKNVIEISDDEEEEHVINIPIERKKFKFVAKSDRNIEGNVSRVEGIGFMNRKKHMKRSVDVKHNKQLLQVHHDDDHNSDENETNKTNDEIIQTSNETNNKTNNEMVWTVVDNLSSDSSDGHNENNKVKYKKKKKHGKKSKKKKSKHKKRSKKKHKHKHKHNR